ncbi:MAG: glycosyltransferase family 2 protein [Solirubrobacteraceae bacterium]
MKISVIVALHRYTDEARQCLQETLLQLRPGDQLLAVSDQPIAGLPDGVEARTTGSPVDTSPAEKRDAAMAYVTGDACAFLDDDAYPAEGWIQRMSDYFDEDPTLGGIGGPGISPPGGRLAQRLGGAYYESRLGSGGLRERFVAIGERHPIDDWPAYNLIIRTDALRDVGGWASKLYGGEDTKLCLALVNGGHRLDFIPDVVVYHHRRALFGPLWRQIGNIGYQRGRFVKLFPETSRRPIYFVPSAALIAAPVFLLWSLGSARRRRFAFALITGGWGAVTALSLQEGMDPVKAALTPVALGTGHGAYGWRFIRGLVTNDTENV